MQLKTQGIILKQRNIGEHDRILTILSPDLGVFEASARGIKSMKSRIAGGCQPLCFSELSLYYGKGNYTVHSAEVVNSFYSLRFDVVKLSLAGYFCELLYYLSPTPDHAAVLLKLLLNTLHLLQEDRRSPVLLKAVFELRSLTVAGFMPNLVGCTECGEYEKEWMYFFPLDGNMICKDCYVTDDNAGVNPLKFQTAAPVLSSMRHIVFSVSEKVFSFKLSENSLKQLSFMTEQYVLLHTQGRFKSLELYHQLTSVS